MANYLYYVGGCDIRPSQNGMVGTIEFSWFDIAGASGPAAVKPTDNVVIANPGGNYDGNFAGDAFSGGGGLNGSYNNNDNWTGDWNAAGFQGSPQVYVIGAVDIDTFGSADVPGQVNGMYDRNGTLQDLVCHHGAVDYIVLAPGNVSKFGSQRDGTVLVWYCAGGSLGANANAIGLPMAGQNYPVAGDTDIEAAAKILYHGLGVFRVNGGDQEPYGWVAVG